MLNSELLARRVDEEWTQSIEAKLADYVRIPNKSSLFDPEWEANGHMDRAAALLSDWAHAQPVKIGRAHV